MLLHLNISSPTTKYKFWAAERPHINVAENKYQDQVQSSVSNTTTHRSVALNHRNTLNSLHSGNHLKPTDSYMVLSHWKRKETGSYTRPSTSREANTFFSTLYSVLYLSPRWEMVHNLIQEEL